MKCQQNPHLRARSGSKTGVEFFLKKCTGLASDDLLKSTPPANFSCDFDMKFVYCTTQACLYRNNCYMYIETLVGVLLHVILYNVHKFRGNVTSFL